MKTILHTAPRALRCALALISALSFQLSAFAQSTAFTYQGRLDDGGSPANGIYDLRFSIYDAISGGAQQGGALTNMSTVLSNGLFTVVLDFGNQFPGADRWLELGVRTNGGGAFATLSPRQRITSTPYAITSGNVTGFVPASQVSGTLAPAQLPAVMLTNNQTGVSLTGTFTGDGAGLTGLNASELTTGTVDDARLSGNVALRSGDATFHGTLKAQGRLIGRELEVGTNVLLTGVLGTIAGGAFNTNAGDYAVIGGGLRNEIEPLQTAAVIAGGDSNTNAGTYSVIGGGFENSIETGIGGGHAATIAGGWRNSIGERAQRSTIGGGAENRIGPDAAVATIAGGVQNTVNVLKGFIGGGEDNLITSNGVFGVIPGGRSNQVSQLYGFAAGNRAQANHTGAFVWADSQNADFASTASNQFNVRASGGARFVTGGAGLTVDGQPVFAGVVSSEGLSGPYANAVALTNAGNSFAGNGAGLTHLNADQLQSGTVPDARLSSNVALKNQNNTFSVNQSVPAGTAATPGLSFNGDLDTGLFSPAANTLALTTGATERMRLTSGGLLGLGTNTPAARLHIASAGSTPQLHLGQYDSANAFTRIRFSVGDTNLWDLAAGGTANVMNFFNSGNGNVMTLSPNGHLRVNTLGVGTDSTAAHLTVAGDSSQPQLRLQQTTSGAAPRLRMINGNSPYWDMLAAANGDYIRWYSEKTGFNAMTLQDNGTLTTAGPVNPPSDRNVKQDFAPVDTVAVLEKVAALPIQSWAYKNSPDVRHLGPVAQDFHAAFQLNGPDDKHISTVDADGVALAAIQGLNQKVESGKQRAEMEIAELRAENAALKARLEKLETLLSQ